MQRPDFVGHREHWIGQGRNERKQQIAMGDEPVSSSSSPFLIDMYPLMVARKLSKRTDHSGVDPPPRRRLEGYTHKPRQTFAGRYTRHHDRKRAGSGKSVSARVAFGGSRTIKKKTS